MMDRPTYDQEPSGRGPNGTRLGTTPPWHIAAVVGILLTILALVVILIVRQDDQSVETTSSTSTTGPTLTTASTSTTTTSATSATDSSSTTMTTTSTSTSSTTATTTTSSATTTTASTSTTIDPAPYRTAVWPWVGSPTRYDDPAAAARGFAEDYVGFDNPVVGPFLEGDGRSGEVEVRPSADGPLTLVLVRQLDQDDTWWVLGSVTANLRLDEPDAFDKILSPVAVAGAALAPDGIVEVELRADGFAALADAVVSGGETEPTPFEVSLPFVTPDEFGGAIVVITSEEDGQVREATVARIYFGQGS